MNRDVPPTKVSILGLAPATTETLRTIEVIAIYAGRTSLRLGRNDARSTRHGGFEGISELRWTLTAATAFKAGQQVSIQADLNWLEDPLQLRMVLAANGTEHQRCNELGGRDLNYLHEPVPKMSWNLFHRLLISFSTR